MQKKINITSLEIIVKISSNYPIFSFLFYILIFCLISTTSPISFCIGNPPLALIDEATFPNEPITQEPEQSYSSFNSADGLRHEKFFSMYKKAYLQIFNKVTSFLENPKADSSFLDNPSYRIKFLKLELSHHYEQFKRFENNSGIIKDMLDKLDKLNKTK